MNPRLICLALSACLLTACGRDSGPLPPLAYVPADTPYVMAALDPVPLEVAQTGVAMGNLLLPSYREFLDLAIANLERDSATESGGLPLLRALRAELGDGDDISAVIEAWGFSLTPLSAFYGIDLVPVMRVELADPQRFTAGVARLESAAGTALARGSVDDLGYWSFQPEGAPLQTVFAVHGNQLVLTLAPAAADDALLRRLFGLELPERSLLDSESLEALNRRFGFVDFGSGYLDHARLFELLAKPMSGSQGAFLKAMKFTPPNISSETCLAEGRAMVAQWPRTALGYTRFDAGGYRMRAVLEAPAPVLADLRGLLAPTPGLGEAAAALASFSVALKVDALPPLAGKWASAVRSAPWACEALQPLNEAFLELGEALQNPAVYAVGPSANAVHVMLDVFEPAAADADNDEPTVEGRLLIGSPNPQGLVAMARNFVPELAEFRLEPDAEPVALPTLPNTPDTLQLFGAASAEALGIALGEGQRDRLQSALAVDAGADRPLLQFSYRGAVYGSLMRMVTQQAAIDDPDAPDMSAMFELYEDMIERVDGQLLFSADGIEFTSEVVVPQR